MAKRISKARIAATAAGHIREANVTRDRSVTVALVRVSGGGRTRKVDTYARQKLEDSARRRSGGRVMDRLSEQLTVGEHVFHAGRYWVVGATCGCPVVSAWTLLRPERDAMRDADDALPVPLSRGCVHGR